MLKMPHTHASGLTSLCRLHVQIAFSDPAVVPFCMRYSVQALVRENIKLIAAAGTEGVPTTEVADRQPLLTQKWHRRGEDSERVMLIQARALFSLLWPDDLISQLATASLLRRPMVFAHNMSAEEAAPLHVLPPASTPACRSMRVRCLHVVGAAGSRVPPDAYLLWLMLLCPMPRPAR